jgi:hypothetical protein
MQNEMIQAMEFLSAAEHGKVKMQRGKVYSTVALRVEAFRRNFPTYSLVTEIILDDGEVVRVKATIARDGQVLATGHAEEVRGSSNVNKTSALENCETSAIGRCLSSFGLSGGEFASANEVEHAVSEQEKPAVTEETLLALNQLFDDAGKTEAEKDEYRKKLRIAAWRDLTEERAQRVLDRLDTAFAREYAEAQAANAKLGDE